MSFIVYSKLASFFTTTRMKLGSLVIPSSVGCRIGSIVFAHITSDIIQGFRNSNTWRIWGADDSEGD